MKRDSILWAMTDIADDLIREAKEAPMKHEKRTFSRTARFALIAAVIAALLAVSAGAYYVIHNWNSVLERRFQPTEDLKEQMDGMVDEPVAASTMHGVTLSVEQTITDGSELYAVISMKLPEDFDMSRLIVSSENELEPETLRLFSSYDEATGHWYSGPSTVVALWFQGEHTREELDSLTIEEVESGGEEYWDLMATGGSFLPKQVDVENHTVYYLLMTDLNETAGDYTVWFDKVTLGDVDGEALIDGPFYVTWTPSYDESSTIERSIQRNGAEIGTMTLSPISLCIDIPNLFDTMATPPAGEALERFTKAASGVLTEAEAEEMDRDPVNFWSNHPSIDDYVNLSIQYTDGASQALAVNCSSEYDEATGRVHIWLQESLYGALGTFLDVDTVQSVTVNDVVIPISR